MGVLVFNNGMNDTVSKLLESMDIPVHPAMPKQWEPIDSMYLAGYDYKSEPAVKQRRKTQKGKVKEVGCLCTPGRCYVQLTEFV